MMEHVIKHFRKVDPVLASAASSLEPITPGRNYFSDLCEAIIQQQLSTKAGDTLWARFLRLFLRLTPDSLLGISDGKIRAAGISWSKVGYLKNAARFVLI